MGLYRGLDLGVFGNAHGEEPRTRMAFYYLDVMLMFVAATALASLHHCLLLLSYVAAPATSYTGSGSRWSDAVKHSSSVGGVKNHKGIVVFINCIQYYSTKNKIPWSE